MYHQILSASNDFFQTLKKLSKKTFWNFILWSPQNYTDFLIFIQRGLGRKLCPSNIQGTHTSLLINHFSLPPCYWSALKTLGLWNLRHESHWNTLRLASSYSMLFFPRHFFQNFGICQGENLVSRSFDSLPLPQMELLIANLAWTFWFLSWVSLSLIM